MFSLILVLSIFSLIGAFETSVFAQSSKRTAVPKPIVPGEIILEQDRRIAPDTLYAYFNHNSGFFDRDSTTLASTQRLDSLVNARKIPSFLASQRFDANLENTDYFLTGRDVTYPVKSFGGAHNIEFPNLRAMVFSGGHLDRCLCEAIRDTARGTGFGSDPVKYYLVSDAIYTDAFAGFGVIPLRQAMDASDDAGKLAFIEKVLRTDSDRICDSHNSNNILSAQKAGAKWQDFTLRIQIEGRTLGTLGNGPKKLDIVITTLAELGKTYLSSSTKPPVKPTATTPALKTRSTESKATAAK